MTFDRADVETELARLSRTADVPISDIAWGSRQCVFFQTARDLVNTFVPYFKTGLERHEQCLGGAATADPEERASCELSGDRPTGTSLRRWLSPNDHQREGGAPDGQPLESSYLAVADVST